MSKRADYAAFNDCGRRSPWRSSPAQSRFIVSGEFLRFLLRRTPFATVTTHAESVVTPGAYCDATGQFSESIRPACGRRRETAPCGFRIERIRALPATIVELLELGRAGIQRATAAAATGESFPLGSVKLLAPVPRPEKVICVGLNYADHARETGKELPSEPVIFNKFVTAVSAHGDPIVLPTSAARWTTKRNWWS